MIKSFRNRDTQAFFEGQMIRRWLAFTSQAERRLQILDSATCLDDLRNLPSNRFKALGGDRKGQYSINIQWRICFLWIDNEPQDVEIVDYH